MKSSIIILLLSLPLLTFSQQSSSIDFIGGIDYTYRVLKVDDLFTNVRSGDMWKANWRIGFNYNKRVSQHLFLKGGIRFASVGYHGKKETGLRYGSEHDGMGGWTPDPTLVHERQFTYDYWFIELPVVGRYEFNAKKISPFVELGFAPTYYLTTRIHEQTDLGDEKYFWDGDVTANFNKLHIVGIFSIGFNYTASEKIQLFAQPTFRYHLTKLVSDAQFSEYLISAGIELGARKFLTQ